MIKKIHERNNIKNSFAVKIKEIIEYRGTNQKTIGKVIRSRAIYSE